MLRFFTKNLIPNYHNVYKPQQSSINSLCCLQTLALQSNNSNTCNSKNQHDPTVSYLVNKCGLPLHSAISASKQITITSTHKADSVLHLFRSYGFTQTQVAKLISSCPSLIKYDSINTLKPKLEFFESLGLSKEDLARFVSADTTILKRSLRDKLIPNVNFLRTVLKTNECLVRTLKRWPRIVHSNYRVALEPNLLTLRDHGMPDLNICKLLMMCPRAFLLRNEAFRDKVERVQKLGVSSASPAYLNCLRIMLCMSDSLGEKR